MAVEGEISVGPEEETVLELNFEGTEYLNKKDVRQFYSTFNHDYFVVEIFHSNTHTTHAHTKKLDVSIPREKINIYSLIRCRPKEYHVLSINKHYGSCK